MKTKHATAIRRGIEAAKRTRPGGFTILNNRYYNKLALRAFNVYQLRHWRDSYGRVG